MKRIKLPVFLPPFLLLLGGVALNFIDKDTFVSVTTNAHHWVLDTFGWLFSLAAFFMLAVCVAIYFSPFGRVIIGGPGAKPLLTRWRWFAIALCSGIGIGIVFFGAGEPISHLGHPPQSLHLAPNSPEAALFAMSTMYLHWTFVPYAIYSVAALMFAFAYYNMKKPFSLGSPLWPILGKRCRGLAGDSIDAVCLYALVTGLAAALGGGLMLLSGGLNHIFGIEGTPNIWAIIGVVIVGTFTLSAVSGLMKGIRILSTFNALVFIGLMIYIFIFGPTRFILSFGVESFGHFLGNFFQRSLFTGVAAQDEWSKSWTTFYWAWWFACAPVMAVFLGRISYGYSVRQFMIFNLVLPACFGAAWMAIFGGTAIYLELYQQAGLVETFDKDGIEAIMYALMAHFPLAKFLIPAFLFTAFLSFVTCADSNTSAMSSISSTGISPESPEPSTFIKVVWGTLTGTIAWIMISFAHIKGMKMLCILGGLPAMLLCVAIAAALIRVARNPVKYDEFKQGYDAAGQPIEKGS